MTLLSLPIVLDVVAKASVILALTALVAAALRRASASARHFVWTLGLLSALAVPALSVALPRWEIPIVRARGPAPAPVSNAWPPPPAGSPPPPPQHFPAPAATPPPTSAPGPPRILGRMPLGLPPVLGVPRRPPIVPDAPWLAQAHALARGLGLSHVRFLRTGGSTMPMAWGIFRSSVVIPADADGWPAHRLRVVLLHELAHVKRRDCLTHIVAQIACAAYWFNPLAWM